MSAYEAKPVPRWQIVVSWILSCLPVLAFLPSAFFKLAQPGEFTAQWSKTYPAATARPIGIAELLFVVIYFIPKTRVLGAILVTGYLGGAIATHVQKMEAAGIMPFLIAVMLWGGLFLREPRLRALVPTSKD
jgi:hypothetical protein